MERFKRANLINSMTGIKPANLIATKSEDGFPNVGIFSSVVHLGSDPAVIGFVMRPQDEKPRDTYLNIKATGVYTINHVPTGMVENAHFTSAKFPKEQSEFEYCGFQEEYIEGFHAPFVKESPLKFGLELVDEIPIRVNKTILMIGKVQHLIFPDEAMSETGQLNLETLGSAGISGLDGYYDLRKIGQFPYAHLKDVPEKLKLE
ncbi:MAG: flavin reductase [Cytophagales bacterium]|nr:flavin reductase [Cytophagales bacterium]